MTELILSLLLVAAVASGFLFSRREFARGKREAELEAAPLSGRTQDLAARLEAAEARLAKAEEVFRESQKEKGVLEAKAERLLKAEEELASLREKLVASERDLSGTRSRLKQIEESLPQTMQAMRLEFAEISGKLLKEKGEDFAKQSKEGLDGLLNPLRDQIKEFREKVEKVQNDGSVQHGELKEQLKNLLGMNARLSTDAQNLAAALKGENKASGNWGELVLERVLEMSGLQRGREYELQEGYRNDEGKLKLPDAVIKLPEERQLVIDSKVSLVAYDRYCSAETPEAAVTELAAHVGSVRQHVKKLADQRYQDLPGMRSPDFVFLFMPVEPAFIVAVKEDSTLFQEAFERNIIIVSPSTLLATLRTVANIWKQEYRHRNVHKIAIEAGLLHDKFVGFLESLSGIGDGLSKAQRHLDEARGRIKDGSGNLLGKFDKIKQLGAAAKKKIPASWREDAGETDADEASPGEPSEGEEAPLKG